METIGVLLVTSNTLDNKLFDICKQSIIKSLKPDTEIVSVSINGSCDIGRNIELPQWKTRHSINLIRQRLVGLSSMESDYVFYLDDDVIYNYSHFYFKRPIKGKIWYNINTWTLDMSTGKTYFWINKVTSACSGYREYLLNYETTRLNERNSNVRLIAEPDRTAGREYFSTIPLIDLKHNKNWSRKTCQKHELYRIFGYQPKCYYSGDYIPFWGKVTDGPVEYLDKVSRNCYGNYS